MRKPASRERILASVELCETEVCFLHIQLIGTNVWLPKMQRIPPDVDFESSRSPAKSESWNNLHLQCCAVFPTQEYNACIHMCDECKRSNAPNVCHMLLFISLPHEQVCSQTSKHQVYQYVSNIDISEQFVSKLWIIHFSSSPNWWSSVHGVATLYRCSAVFFASSQYLSTQFCAWPSMSQDHEDIVSVNFSVALAEILDSNIFL